MRVTIDATNNFDSTSLSLDESLSLSLDESTSLSLDVLTKKTGENELV
jgi:hypothetical protein